MSIATECEEVTGLKPRAKEGRQKFLGRLVKAIEDLEEADWAKLSDDAQGWYKKALKADETGEDIPDFPDVKKDETEEENQVPDTTAKKKPPAKKAANGNGEKKTRGVGYKGHREGSRKEQIHKVFDEKGYEAAVKAGEKVELAELTVKSWIYSWGGKAPKKAKEGARA